MGLPRIADSKNIKREAKFVKQSCEKDLIKLRLTNLLYLLFQDFRAGSQRYIKVVIEGTIGNGYNGDIAIDDILLTDYSCGSGKYITLIKQCGVNQAM